MAWARPMAVDPRTGSFMIPLRLKIDCNAVEPMVVRLRSCEGDFVFEPVTDSDVALAAVGSDGAEYRNGSLFLRIKGIDPSEMDGDVLLLNPSRGTADRLIRANSAHNTLLVTERCDQLCVMCSQPPKKHHFDLFAYFAQAVTLAPENAVIGISGGEPTLFKEDLFLLLKHALESRPDLQFHVLTNAQHFIEPDIELLRSIDMTKVVWGVPLYATLPNLHDEIVGKIGAHSALLANLPVLARAGARIELRTVLMQPNAGELPALSRFIATMLPFVESWAIMQLESIGYGRLNWPKLFYDSSAGFKPIAAALDYATAKGINVALFNFPLCTVPVDYRHFAPSTISDWKRMYFDGCTDCAMREECGGFFAWHPKNHGYLHWGQA